MKYLITGGAGFIGSSLANHLVNDGHDVVVVDDLSMGKKENLQLDKVEFLKGDIRDEKLITQILSKNKFDYIFLLAAVASVADSIKRPIETHEINMNANLEILELVKKFQKQIKRVVFASSAAVYGDDPALPKKEISQIKPLSPYAIDKFATEKYVLAYNHLYNVPTSAVRFFNVYGMNQNPKSPYSGVLSIITEQFKKVLSNQETNFVLYGDGEQTRDFVFVKDVIAALLLVSDKSDAKGEVFNVGTGKPSSLNEVIDIYEQVLNVKLPIKKQDARVGDIQYSFADITKLESLGYESKYDLRKGICEYLEYELKKVD